MITDFSAALAAILIMAIYSYAFLGGSIIYELVCDLAVASSIGYHAISAYESAVRTGWTPMNTNFALNWHFSIAMVIGILLFSVINRKWTWLSRWPSAILLGVGLGLAMSGTMYADVYQQIVSSWTSGYGQWEWIIMIVGIPLTLWHFIFTVPHGQGGPVRTALDRAADIGKAFAFVFIAGKYSGSVVFRIILSVGCLQRILWDWLGLSAPVFSAG